MSLRRRSFTTTCLVGLSFFIVLAGISVWVMLASSLQLEEKNARENIHTAQIELDAGLDQLSTAAHAWEQLYDVKSINSKTAPVWLANLPEKTFSDARVDLAVFIADGQAHYRADSRLPVDAALTTVREIQVEMAANPIGEDQNRSAVVLSNGEPLLVVAEPIAGADSQATVLVLCRRLTDEAQRSPFAELHLGISISPRDDPARPPDFNQAQTALTSVGGIYVHPLDRNSIAAYTLIDDLSGRPYLILRVTRSRDVFALGQISLISILAALLIEIIVAAAFSQWLVSRWIIGRIVSLKAQVNQIAVSGNISRRVTTPGDDELHDLASDINLMLETLESSNHALRESEDRLRQETLHDPLTGLPNRVYFLNQLQHAVDKAHHYDDFRAALYYLDLDRFKNVNDNLGHSKGDNLLVAISGRLQACLRSQDLMARSGGDEFVILLDDVHREGEVLDLANFIEAGISQPILIDGQQIFITASIGIAMIDSEANSPEELLRDADTAMQQAKTSGKARHVIFNRGMRSRNQAAFQLENELRHAIENQEFCVYYQPIVSMADGMISGVEALIRWNHPQRGLVLPGEFIKLAEETGLVVPIGAWVLDTACRQVNAWNRDGLKSVRLSVNISARQLYDHALTSVVRQVLESSGLPAEQLQLEITESASLQDMDITVQILEDLRRMGVQIAIDDFGTSYSSMGYLRRFPIGSIKIDYTFIRDLTTDLDDAAIVSTIIAMGHVLNLRVVAEGVETQAQIDFLAPQKCDELQGFLLGRPAPADRIAELLHSGLRTLHNFSPPDEIRV